MIIFKLVIFLQLSDVYIASSTDSSQGVDHEENLHWTPELDAIVVEIFHKTNTEVFGHQARMKKEWDKIFPQYQGLTALHLRRHALMLINNSGKNKRQNVNWTPELDSELMKMFGQIYKSKNRGLIVKLHSEFYEKHPNVRQVKPDTLWKRAKTLCDRSTPEGNKKLRTRIPWIRTYAKDALQLYHEYPANYKNRALKLHEAWIKLHPEFKEIEPPSVMRQMREIARRAGEENPPSERYEWTKENNADLLHIYHRINPEKLGYTRRLHERWEKMNPELGHINREVLRKRIKYLEYKQYEPSETEMEQARIKFDSLPPPEHVESQIKEPRRLNEEESRTDQNERVEAELDKSPPLGDVGDRGKRLRKMNKRKSKINPPAEHLMFTTAPSRHSRPHKFYDFMSVNESHKGTSQIADESMKEPHVASSTQTSYGDPKAIPNFMNLHHGESSMSNPTPHQHQNSTPDSPLRNPPKEFFNFF